MTYRIHYSVRGVDFGSQSFMAASKDEAEKILIKKLRKHEGIRSGVKVLSIDVELLTSRLGFGWSISYQRGVKDPNLVRAVLKDDKGEVIERGIVVGIEQADASYRSLTLKAYSPVVEAGIAKREAEMEERMKDPAFQKTMHEALRGIFPGGGRYRDANGNEQEFIP